MDLFVNPHKKPNISAKKMSLIAKNKRVIASVILAFNCVSVPVYASSLDNDQSYMAKTVKKQAVVPAQVLQPAATIDTKHFPVKPVDPVVGDMPVKVSAAPAGKRTAPYEQAVTPAVEAVDTSLQIIPDSMQPTVQERRDEIASLEQVRNPKSNFYRSRGMFMDDSSIRNTALTDAARGVGVRAGFSHEAARINRLLKNRYQNVFDNRFPFFHLMLGGGRVIPPVIGEANNLQERSGPNFLFLSIGSYEIVKPASLALREPNWQDYLLLPVSDPRPPEGIRAEGSNEMEAWRKSVDAGWQVGKIEARRTFIANLNRMIRDYQGMQRYHALAKKGAITIPRVQSIKSNRRIEGDRMFVGEERLEIKVSAKFRK